MYKWDEELIKAIDDITKQEMEREFTVHDADDRGFSSGGYIEQHPRNTCSATKKRKDVNINPYRTRNLKIMQWDMMTQ